MTMPTTLLVIEPHENLRDAYASVLRFAGYRVHEASCALTARERLQATRPNLVLVNAHLPTADETMDLLRRARKDRRLDGVTWVAICQDHDGLTWSQQSEFDVVLNTPISYTDLVGLATTVHADPVPYRSETSWQGLELCFS